MPRTRLAALLTLLALIVITMVSCGDDDDATLTGSDATVTTQRDRDRDRDQIHDAVADILDACRDQDRDRLRDHTVSQDRDRLRDGSCDGIADADASIVDEAISVDGDEATATLRLAVRDRNGTTSELGDTWRFRWSDGAWLLSDLPATIDTSAGTPSTLRDQDRDQDCDTPSTLQSQDRDQDCDTPSTLRDQDRTDS